MPGRAGVVVVLLLFAACSDGGSGKPGLHVTTSFTFTDAPGANPSALDPLLNQMVSLDLTLDEPNVANTSSAGCKSTIVGKSNPPRTAGGPVAATMQVEVLDKIDIWDVELELCTVASGSRIVIDASINEINLTIGCLMVPASAVVYDGDGNPRITTMTAASCSTTLLDVVNNRPFTGQGFTVRFET